MVIIGMVLTAIAKNNQWQAALHPYAARMPPVPRPLASGVGP